MTEESDSGCSVVWKDGSGEWTGQMAHLGSNQEVYDAETQAIKRAIRLCVEREEEGQSYTIFSDSKSALERCRDDRPGRGQAVARTIIDGSLRLAINRSTITLSWVPAHKGVAGNEQADSRAKEAAVGQSEEVRIREMATSVAYLKRWTSEEKRTGTKEWIKERVKGRKSYILREKAGMREKLRKEKKSIAARYYQLMTRHALMAPYLENKLKKIDSDTCLWCKADVKQTREHSFKQYSHWKKEIKELWRKVGKEVEWRSAKWRSVARMFRED